MFITEITQHIDIILYEKTCRVIPAFKAAAEELVNSSALSPVELLAKALAKVAVCSYLRLLWLKIKLI